MFTGTLFRPDSQLAAISKDTLRLGRRRRMMAYYYTATVDMDTSTTSVTFRQDYNMR